MIVVVALLVAMVASGCGGGDPVTVPDVVGLKGDKAQTKLVAAGLKVKWSENVWAASNWDVDGQDPAAGSSVNPDATVTLKVSKKGAAANAGAPASKDDDTIKDRSDPGVETTSKGLTASSAKTACDRLAKAEFPYGYKPHWIMGNLAERIEKDRWFLKVEATVTNAFNAKQDVNVECFVNGTDDRPTVEEFNAY